MTVFVAHAPANKAAAEALEKFIERRGQFAELDDGQTALRPVQWGDVVVLLMSKDFVFAPTRLRLEQRALDAWAEGRLIVVKLDHGIAPVGLRDLPAIDASFEAQREFKWQEVANAVRERLIAARTGASDGEDAAGLIDDVEPGESGVTKEGGSVGRLLRTLLMLVLAIPGIVAIAATFSIWLVNRIGPTPGGFPELRAGIDALGVRYGLSAGVAVPLFVAAIAVTVVVLLLLLLRLVRGPSHAKARKRERALPPAPAPVEEAPAGETDAVFVSYARVNSATVMPVIEAAKEAGRNFWVDQKGLTAGDGWAGEIVKAIRGAGGVVVMCSKAAFESDHVKREIYLADRYHKKLVPVFIEDAQPPEDFEYFFAGVQMLKLFETPEAERPEAFARALGAAA